MNIVILSCVSLANNVKKHISFHFCFRVTYKFEIIDYSLNSWHFCLSLAKHLSVLNTKDK